MPELPDVEAARRTIERGGIGATITAVDADPSVLRGVTPRRLRQALSGERLRSAERHGKWLVLRTDGPALAIHLGMTGELRWATAGLPLEAFHRASIRTDRGEIRYADRRKLGGLWLATTGPGLEPVLGRLGPDAATLSCRDLYEVLAGTKRSLKVVLMDQATVAGLGNMLSDEILWRARIHPTRAASGLTPAERQRLCRALHTTVAASVRAGLIPRSARWLSGQRDRASPRCPRAHGPLTWSTINGRSSLWCPCCQSPPRRRS